MSQNADKLRQEAARENAAAITTKSLRDGHLHRKRAQAFNALADNEDWLDGEVTGQALQARRPMPQPS